MTSRAVLAAALLLAAGCNVTFPWSSTEQEDVGLTVEPSALRFEGTLCDPAPDAGRLRLTTHRPDAAVDLEVVPPGAFSVFPLGPRELLVYPLDPLAVGTGEHTATLRLYPRTPEGPIPGDRIVEVPLSWVVSPCPLTLQADATPLEVIAGVTAPVTRSVHAVETDRTAAWSASIVPDAACSGVDVTVSPASGDALPAELTVSAAPSPWGGIVGDTVCAATLRLRESGREAILQIPIHAVQQTLTFDPPSAVLTTYDGQIQLPSQVVAVTPDRAPLTYEVQLRWGTNLSVDAPGSAPGTLSISPASTRIYPGTYDEWVDLAWAGGRAAGYPVRLVVLPPSLAASPTSQVVFTVDNTTTVADLTQTIALTSSAGPISWEASVDVPWARLSPSAGVTGASPGLDLTLDAAFLPTALSSLPLGNLSVDYAEPNGARNRLSLVVYGLVDLPALTGGAPRAVAADTAASLTVGGTMIGSGYTPLAFLVDGGPPLVPSWSNYALATVPLPPLAPGRHVLSVVNALGLDRGTVSFDAVAVVTRAPAAVASPGHRTQLSFDDARGILYAANPGAGAVERYLEASGWALETLDLPGLRDAALSPNGSRLAAVTAGTVRLVDTDTFALATTQPPGVLPGADAPARDWRLAFTADGKALVVPVAQDARPFGTFDGVQVRDAAHWGCGGRLFASVDGRSLGVACRATGSPYAIELYTPGTSYYSAPGSGFSSLWGIPQSFEPGIVTFDPAQSRFLALDLSAPGATETLLLDLRSYTPLSGVLPPTTVTAVVTRDGSRAVTLDGVTGNVRVFDLANLPAGASDLLVELDPPGGLAPVASPGASPVMTLSADERTLFLAGDDGMVVVPLP